MAIVENIEVDDFDQSILKDPIRAANYFLVLQKAIETLQTNQVNLDARLEVLEP